MNDNDINNETQNESISKPDKKPIMKYIGLMVFIVLIVIAAIVVFSFDDYPEDELGNDIVNNIHDNPVDVANAFAERMNARDASGVINLTLLKFDYYREISEENYNYEDWVMQLEWEFENGRYSKVTNWNFYVVDEEWDSQNMGGSEEEIISEYENDFNIDITDWVVVGGEILYEDDTTPTTDFSLYIFKINNEWYLDWEP